MIERFFSLTLGLTEIAPYLPTFYWSFLAFLVIHQVIAPYFSARYFPSAYASKGRLARNVWSIHVVSQVHVLIVVPYALWCILHDSPERLSNPAFGWDVNAGYLHAIACGYFLWDALDAIINFTDAGFVAHGIACFGIFFLSYKPFMSYYGTRVLLWEVSTFFLNIHWFLDKTNRTGSRFQLINGTLLLLSFFSIRIVSGAFLSIHFFSTLLQVRQEISLAYFVIYALGNLMLQGLSWFWFYKMILSIRKRFGNPQSQGSNHKNASALVNGNGRHSVGNGGSI